MIELFRSYELGLKHGGGVEKASPYRERRDTKSTKSGFLLLRALCVSTLCYETSYSNHAASGISATSSIVTVTPSCLSLLINRARCCSRLGAVIGLKSGSRYAARSDNMW